MTAKIEATDGVINSHADIAEAIIWLVTIHKVSNPDCHANCYVAIQRELKRKAKK